MTEVTKIRSIIKEAKTIMSVIDHMDTDGVTVPEISWLLFLKVFDYHEKQRKSLTKGYKTIIPEDCQWDKWAGDKFKGYTGSDLIKFVDNILLDKLSKLTGSKDNRNIDIINSIFNGFQFSLRDGTKLRQVINKLNEITLDDAQDLQNLGQVFEEELINMRNDLKSKASFYTPRPIINFILQKIKPNLNKSEKVMDLASGTSGFLVESLEYMKKNNMSTKDKTKLFTETLYGNEKKSRNYLLGVLNLMLRDVSIPNVLHKNTLASTKISEIVTDDLKYDVIMTNPTFDEKEEKETANNMPASKAMSDAALHFLYFAMKSLRERGRCAIILPNGPLFGTGIAANIKKELLEKFNLHTIIRLPESIFAPYTNIATNIVFFDEGKPTKEIWYYNVKVRKGLKNFTKSNPVENSDFEEVLNWCKNKVENDFGWKVKVEEIKDYYLDRKHPDEEDKTVDLSPHELISQIISDEKKTLGLLEDVEKLIQKEIPK